MSNKLENLIKLIGLLVLVCSWNSKRPQTKARQWK